MTHSPSGAPVVITGVGQRVGLHLARHWLGAGRPVIGTFRSERPALAELRELGAELHQVDFDDTAATERFADTVGERHGAIRALVHNASDWLPEDPVRPHADTLSRMMRVHVEAPYLLNLALADALERGASPYADIVHIGDYVSGRGSAKRIAYAASKAAQDNLTLSFAARLAPKVKVNSIAPALVSFNDDDDAGYRARALEKNVMHREGGYPAFIAMMDFLFDSPFITGRVLPFDGGRHLA